MRHAVSIMALLVLAGCGGSDGTPRSAAVEDNIFLANALAHTQSQLEMAQAAQAKVRTPALAAYVQRIASERPALLARLTAAAQPRGVAGDRNHTPSPDALASVKGEAFERAYVAAQLEDQRNTIDGFAFTAATSADPAIRDLAAGALPQLKQDFADASDVVRLLPFEAATGTSQTVIPGQPMR